MLDPPVSPCEGEREAEVFRTGRTPQTAVVGIAGTIVATAAAVGFVGSCVGFARGEQVPTFVPVCTALASLLLALAVAWAVLARRKCYVALTQEGLVRQDWRGRRVGIPWDRLKQLVVTSAQGGPGLSVRYLDDQDRLRRLDLVWDSYYYGSMVDRLRDAIMRHKSLPKSREVLRWYVVKPLRDRIYEE